MHLPRLPGARAASCRSDPAGEAGISQGDRAPCPGEKPPSQETWPVRREVRNKVPLTSVVGRAGPGLSTALFGSMWGSRNPSDSLGTAPRVGELRLEGATTTTKSSTAWESPWEALGIQACRGIFQSSDCRQRLKVTEEWTLRHPSPAHTCRSCSAHRWWQGRRRKTLTQRDRPKNGIFLILLQEFGEEP